MGLIWLVQKEDTLQGGRYHYGRTVKPHLKQQLVCLRLQIIPVLKDNKRILNIYIDLTTKINLPHVSKHLGPHSHPSRFRPAHDTSVPLSSPIRLYANNLGMQHALEIYYICVTCETCFRRPIRGINAREKLGVLTACECVEHVDEGVGWVLSLYHFKSSLMF